MNDLSELRRRLAAIHITLKADAEEIRKLMKDLLEAGRSIGLEAEKRAEGYALTPSRKAAEIGLPHLRIAWMGDLLTVWVRAPYSLDEMRCEMVGIEAEKLYGMILLGARRMADVLRRSFKEDDFLQVTLPQT